MGNWLGGGNNCSRQTKDKQLSGNIRVMSIELYEQYPPPTPTPFLYVLTVFPYALLRAPLAAGAISRNTKVDRW
jgi:hypothetical protein